MDDDTMPFGQWLRKQRRSLDLTQAELARRLGYALITVRKIESGDRKPSKQIALLTADIFSIPQNERALFVEYARSELPPINPDDKKIFNPEDQSQSPWRTPEKMPANHNLPVQLTSFIGREGEVKKVRQLLKRSRLLTLTGSGGCGKTRLSLQAASGLFEVFPDGIWFVDLAVLTDAFLIPQAIADSLGIQDQAWRPLLDVLGDYLASKQMLLILDNCEHVIDECARCVHALLRAAPSIKILTTSREALGTAGETLFLVPSLQVPDPDMHLASENLAMFEAVQLFVDRTVSVLPDFSITEDNIQSIAEICAHLDGIPLAIELASARMRSMPIEQIESMLDDRFQLLTVGNRGTQLRHHTLRAAIDWSYDLLSEIEQVFFSRLSVFTSGWTLEAAAAVCAVPGAREMETLDLLARLVDKSMVLYGQAGGKRYSMLETIRQYASERLNEWGETTAVRQKHADYFLSLVDDAAPYLMSAKRGVSVERLEPEHSNLLTALAFFDELGASVQGLALAGTLWGFWEVSGHLELGRKWLERMLNLADRRVGGLVWANALLASGECAFIHGDYLMAEARYNECLIEYRKLGDRRGIAWALVHWAWMANDRGDFTRAKSYAEESLALFREISDQQGIGFALTRLGLVEYIQGNFRTALPYFRQSVAIYREIGDKLGAAYSLYNLASVVVEVGDVGAALELVEESVRLCHELGDRRGLGYALSVYGLIGIRKKELNIAASKCYQSLSIFHEIGDKWGMRETMVEIAVIAGMRGRFEIALVLASAAETLNHAIGGVMPEPLRKAGEQLIDRTRRSLRPQEITEAFARGMAMNLEEALALALEEAGAIALEEVFGPSRVIKPGSGPYEA